MAPLYRLALVLPDDQRLVLRDEILRRSKTDASHLSHNIGGWRSASTILDWPEISWLRCELIKLFDGLRPTIDPTTIRAWAVVNRLGSSHARHMHSYRYAWSGIYFVDPGGQPSARTLFELGGKTEAVTPELGLVVLFHPLTWHWVEEHRGESERVTVAFDVKAPPPVRKAVTPLR